MPRVVDDPQTIVRLEAANVKRLKAVRVTPTGALVVVAGRNAQGKSSVLDSVMYALAGKRAIPDRPVRDGADKAVIEIETEALIIKRTITAAGGGQLTISRKPGVTVPKPQTVLDQLTGELSFDPLAFTRLDRRAQAERLRQLAGLDTAQIDADREAAYNTRTEVNRELKAARARLDKLPHYPDAPDAEVNAADLMAEIDEAERANKANAAKRKALEELRAEYDQRAADLLLQPLQGGSALVAEHRAALESLNQRGRELKVDVDALQDVDVAAARQRLVDVSEINSQVRANAERDALELAVGKHNTEVLALTTQIEDCDRQREAAIAEATMPIDGLALDAEGVVTFGGVPFDQCSQAEQIRVSVAMGLAANPDLRVLLIRDGSLLDADNLRAISEQAQAHGAQVWIERVSDGEGATVVIEDGEVKE